MSEMETKEGLPSEDKLLFGLFITMVLSLLGIYQLYQIVEILVVKLYPVAQSTVNYMHPFIQGLLFTTLLFLLLGLATRISEGGDEDE